MVTSDNCCHTSGLLYARVHRARWRAHVNLHSVLSILFIN